MKVTSFSIPDVLLIEPQLFRDERGFFLESFNQKQFEEIVGKKFYFVQDNHSCSKRGVLRGLHYQLPPSAQGKLVRVVRGEIFDVAIDIRSEVATFGKWVSAILSAENKRQLWIPPGFAHGFLTLSESAEVMYKATNYYAPETERSILWNDKELNIDWPQIGNFNISDKDAHGVALSKAEVYKK